MEPAVIEVETGRVRGLAENDIGLWRAIPYAAPPVGALRFRAPAPAIPWHGIRDAREFRDASMSHRFSAPRGLLRRQQQSEDCLTLNVCAPITKPTQPRPVMIYIHGGGNFEGSSGWPIYDPRPLVRRGDIVLVSINYRLNAFGYADFSPYSTPGRPFDSNIGLRDQVAALEWVQRNIGAFGGDPDNVTIFGESAGGSAVLTLLATPAATGLFQRAIAQSAADMTLSKQQAQTYAAQLLKRLGATPENASETLSLAPAESICGAALRLMQPSMKHVPGRFPFGPVIDGDFLPEDPLVAIARGHARHVPLIIGSNLHELNAYRHIVRALQILPVTTPLIDRMFSATDPAAKEGVLAAYAGCSSPAAAAQFATDCIFRRPALEACEGHQRYAPTYLYRFDYVPKVLRKLGIGAFHGLDVLFAFGIREKSATQMLRLRDADAWSSVTDELQQHWLNFARYGTPMTNWPKYTSQRRATMVFDHPPRIVNDLDGPIRDAWTTYAGPQRDRAQPRPPASREAVDLG